MTESQNKLQLRAHAIHRWTMFLMLRKNHVNDQKNVCDNNLVVVTDWSLGIVYLRMLVFRQGLFRHDQHFNKK